MTVLAPVPGGTAALKRGIAMLELATDGKVISLQNDERDALLSALAATQEMHEALEYISQLNDAKIENADLEITQTLLRLKVDCARAALAKATPPVPGGA